MKDNTVPLTLISLLADGDFPSGEQLGEKLGMSRAAINKHIQTLRDWGVDVFTVPGKGYCLPEPIQLLEAERIQRAVDYGDVAVLPVIDSTNQYLLDRIGELKSGDACVAEYQQAGRGRRGRKWFSPFGANLYLSMYWRLEQGPAAAIGLSLVIGIVMAEVLQSLGAEKVRVKWPNDLYLNDRKLAGILVELTGKTGDAAQIVIGAGINLVMRRVENDVINQGWINLQEAGIVIDRNVLAARLINELHDALHLFEQEGLAPYLSRWDKLDNFINRPVKLIIGDKEIFGISRGIDTQGALLLEQEGVITGYRANLDPGKMGFNFVALVFATLKEGDRKAVSAFEEAVEEIPQIVMAQRLFGDPDYLMQVVTRDLSSFQKLYDQKLSAMPGVQHLRSTLVMKTVVQDRPFPL